MASRMGNGRPPSPTRSAYSWCSSVANIGGQRGRGREGEREREGGREREREKRMPDGGAEPEPEPEKKKLTGWRAKAAKKLEEAKKGAEKFAKEAEESSCKLAKEADEQLSLAVASGKQNQMIDCRSKALISASERPRRPPKISSL